MIYKFKGYCERYGVDLMNDNNTPIRLCGDMVEKYFEMPEGEVTFLVSTEEPLIREVFDNCLELQYMGRQRVFMGPPYGPYDSVMLSYNSKQELGKIYQKHPELSFVYVWFEDGHYEN